MKVFEGMLNILYPNRCPICQKLLPIGTEPDICEECKDNLHVIGEPKCLKCGKPIDSKEIGYCLDCLRQKHVYEKGWCLWLYDACVKSSISRYKYHNQPCYAPLYAKELLVYYKDEILKHSINRIIPVPLHSKKLKQRGFNQAALIAEIISKEMDIPYDPTLLRRIHDTKPQKALTHKDRYRNVISAFELVEDASIHNLNILIVDDIYTTGSTINSCAKVLLRGGANKIFFIALATGKGLSI